MRIGIFILLSLLLYSCSKTSETEQYAKLVEQWQGKEIIFPDVMTDFLTGDTIDLSNADFTILTYIDSEGCTGCKMKLPLWTEFLNDIDSTLEADIASVIVVNTKDFSETAYLLKRDSYNYPVYIDHNDTLNYVNKFPEDENPMFRTFLLDKSNHVIAIGNPAYQASIAHLYKSILSGEKTLSSTTTTMIEVNNPNIDFGIVRLGETVSHDFTLSNKGNDTVFVRKIITSYECTEADISAGFIAPMSEITASVKFKEDSIIGDFKRFIHIFYNDFDYPTVIQLSGKIENTI